MHPRGLRAAVVHHQRMGLVPVVLGRPPERCERRRKVGGWRGLPKAASELIERHAYSPPCPRSSPPALGRERPGGLFHHVAKGEQGLFVEGAADELQPQRQTL